MNGISIIKTTAILIPLILANINCYGAIMRDPTTGVYSANNITELNELIKEGNVVVDFSGEKWCKPCQMFAPIFAKVAAGTTNVVFVKVDVDKFRPKDIRGIPTIIFYKDGKKVSTKVGYQTETQFRTLIASTFGN
jgi:thioredoxin-like negative regulator of GroEL